MRVALVRVGPGLEGDLDRLLADEGDVRDLLVDTGADEVEVVHLRLVLHADRVGAGAQRLDVRAILPDLDLETRSGLALESRSRSAVVTGCRAFLGRRVLGRRRLLGRRLAPAGRFLIVVATRGSAERERS